MNNREFLEFLLANFPRAVTALNMRWNEGGGVYNDRWKRLSTSEHRVKLSSHYQRSMQEIQTEDHMAAVAWRAILVLEKRGDERSAPRQAKRETNRRARA